MGAALLLLVTGIALMVTSGTLTARRARDFWGHYPNRIEMAMIKGRRVVPSWMSVLGLLGWLAIAAAVVAGVAAAV